MSKKAVAPAKPAKDMISRQNRMKAWFSKRWSDLKKNHRIVWFVVLFTALLVYCIVNWADCIDFTTINGNNILFGMLIILAFVPLISKIVVSVGDKKLEISNAEAVSRETRTKVLEELAKKGDGNNV